MRRLPTLIAALVLAASLLLAGSAVGATAAGAQDPTTPSTCPPPVDYPPTMPPVECRDPEPTTTTTRAAQAPDDGGLADTGAAHARLLLQIALVVLALGALLRHAAKTRAARRAA